MTTWTLMISIDGTLTACPLLREPQFMPAPEQPLTIFGFVAPRRPDLFKCEIMSTDPAMIRLMTALHGALGRGLCHVLTTDPWARVVRTAGGSWQVKSRRRYGHARGGPGGPTRTYRTKALAERERRQRGDEVQRGEHLVLTCIDLRGGGVSTVDSIEHGVVFVQRDPNVATLTLAVLRR